MGTLIIGHAREINWDDLKVAFPSFLTIALMPLTYSIAYGVLAGILANITLWLLLGLINIIMACFGRERQGRPPLQVLKDMFQCWVDAFSDFRPGLKAEWRGVFANRVIDQGRGEGDTGGKQGRREKKKKTVTAAEQRQLDNQLRRLSDGNGNWDVLAVNQASPRTPSNISMGC